MVWVVNTLVLRELVSLSDFTLTLTWFLYVTDSSGCLTTVKDLWMN